MPHHKNSGSQSPNRFPLPLTLWLLWTLSIPLVTPAWSEAACPALPQAPVVEALSPQPSWQGLAKPYLARYALPYGEEANYGVGYLRPVKPEPFYYDWPRHLLLPLWSSPDANDFFGWTYSAEVHPAHSSEKFALTGAGLVETDYEQSSFIVYKTVDGWLQLRLKPGDDGLVWTHRCHLQHGQAKLSYQHWAHFLTEHRDWLHFRSRVPHALRAQPDARSERVTMIGLDHKLILHEIRGDWMRVTVEQPDTTCNGHTGKPFDGLSHDGWVKWRDEQQGPWVWVYTRGC